jgi:tetratricopeptide (TPR) repeat protein
MWGDWRYIHAPRPQLFDLAADPKEADDRYGEQPDLDRRMLTELSEFLTANESLSVGEAMQTADEETLSRLAALGYLQHNVDELTEMSDMLEVDGLVDPKDRVVDIGLFSEAKAAMARGNWNVAHALFKQLVARSPENVVAYQSLATLYGQIGQWDKALEMLDIALEARPGDRQMLGFLGQIYVELGRYREGIDVLTAIPNPEQSVEACTWVGWAHQQLGESEQAEHWFRAGLKLDPHQRWLRLYLANQLASEKRFDEAESLYKGLITDAPYFHLGYYNYGLLLMERGDREAARGLLQRAADLAPRHAPSQAALKALEEGP